MPNYTLQRVSFQLPAAEASGWQISRHILHYLVRHSNSHGGGTKPSRHYGPPLLDGCTGSTFVPVLFHHYRDVVQAI